MSDQGWEVVDRTRHNTPRGRGRGGTQGGSRGSSQASTQSNTRAGSVGNARGGNNQRGRANYVSPHGQGGSDYGSRGSSAGTAGDRAPAPRYVGTLPTVQENARAPPQLLRQATSTACEEVHRLENTLVPPNRPTNSSSSVVARRPGYSAKGAPLLLYTNYFELALKNPLPMYCYSVSVITGPHQAAPRGKKMARIMQLLLREPLQGKQLVTDFGSMIVSRERLFHEAQAENEYSIEYSAEDSQNQTDPPVYRLLVKYTHTVDVQQLLDHLSSAVIDDANPQVKLMTIQALNIIIGHGLKGCDQVAVEKNKYFALSGAAYTSFELGPGLDAFRGYLLSVRPTTGRILLNAQIKHLASYRPGPLEDIMTSLGFENGCGAGVLRQIARFIKGMPVMLTHFSPNRPKKLFGLASTTDGQNSPHPPQVSRYGAGPREVLFYLDSESRYVTVADFFRRSYNINANEQTPVVNIGTAASPRYVLADVCNVVAGQQFRSKLSPDHTKSMIQGAVRKPFANATSIKGQAVALIQAYTTTNLQNFGVEMDTDLVVVKGRILNAPTLYYNLKNSTTMHAVTPVAGGWSPYKFEGKFSTPGTLQCERWNFLWVRVRARRQPSAAQGSSSQAPDNQARQPLEQGCRSFPVVQAGVEALREALTFYGVRVENANRPIVGHQLELEREEDCQSAINQKFQEIRKANPQLQMLLVVLPSDGRHVYNAVKRAGDITHGIHTICVTNAKFYQPRADYLANLALKFNLKLGGRNQTVNTRDLDFISQGTTMVVGLDVTHPAPGENHAPSIAAIVASTDRYLGQWPAEVCIQARRQEMIQGLRDMVVRRLRLWRVCNNNALPQNILIYRDGVSEGQYDTVLNEELPRIKQACAGVYPANMSQQGFPKISIVVVGKRHHSRFYPMRDSDAIASNGNVKNGTVVDRGVTETRYWDFYLHAHKSLLGTAKSAHYVVVHDEVFRHQAELAMRMPRSSTAPPIGQLMAETLESVTHNMCYLFGPATKAISVCPPAYYADIACERARCWLSRMFGDYDPIDQAQPANARLAEVTLHPNLRNTMFYI